MAHIEALSVDIGPRVGGSDGERAAVAYIAAEFRAIGYDVEVMDFEFDGDLFRAATIASPAATIDATTMSGSAGGTVSGPAIYVGLADAEGIAGRDLTGKVAIADRGVLLFSEKYQNVKAAGAVGLIVVNNEEGVFVGTLSGGATIPVVGVVRSDGSVLRQAAAAGEAVTVTTPGGGRTTSQNVIARPAPGAACEILVGGHHDTVPASPGALDNASGTATTLELARAFAADGIDKGLCFATFGAEESGLHGSAALVRTLRAQDALPRYMVNLDMTGLGDTIELFGANELTAKAATLAAGMGIAATPSQLGMGFGSDHQSFQQAGVPVIFFATNSLGNFHTPADTIDTIDPAALGRTGDLAYAFIAELLVTVARA